MSCCLFELFRLNIIVCIVIVNPAPCAVILKDHERFPLVDLLRQPPVRNWLFLCIVQAYIIVRPVGIRLCPFKKGFYFFIFLLQGFIFISDAILAKGKHKHQSHTQNDANRKFGSQFQYVLPSLIRFHLLILVFTFEFLLSILMLHFKRSLSLRVCFIHLRLIRSNRALHLRFRFFVQSLGILSLILIHPAFSVRNRSFPVCELFPVFLFALFTVQGHGLFLALYAPVRFF